MSPSGPHTQMHVYPETCAHMHMRAHRNGEHTHTQHIHIEGGGVNVTEASKIFDSEDQCQPLGKPGKEPPICRG